MGRASSRDGMRHNTPCSLSLPALIPCCVVRVWEDGNDVYTNLIAVQYSSRASCINHET